MADTRGGLTCEECAAILGTTVEDVRQTEKAALQKLRQWALINNKLFMKIARAHYRDSIDEPPLRKKHGYLSQRRLG